MNLCDRHLELLATALELRGHAIINDDDTPAPALEDALKRITTHATHFAGKAAIRMLVEEACPLCFVNNNPAGINLDGWVENAADEIGERQPGTGH